MTVKKKAFKMRKWLTTDKGESDHIVADTGDLEVTDHYMGMDGTLRLGDETDKVDIWFDFWARTNDLNEKEAREDLKALRDKVNTLENVVMAFCAAERERLDLIDAELSAFIERAKAKGTGEE